MLPAFEGSERWLPRRHREILHSAVSCGDISLDRFTSTTLRSRIQSSPRTSTNDGAPTARCTEPAVLAHYETRGINPRQVHLHGHDVHDRDAPYLAGFKLGYLRAVPSCLTEHGDGEWNRGHPPDQDAPLDALRISRQR